MNLLQNIIQGFQPLNQSSAQGDYSTSLTDLLLASVVRATSKRVYTNTALHSFYKLPIDLSDNKPHGYSRNWGDASSEVQMGVMKSIIEESKHLDAEDRAILLGIARLESGFNPDAAATTTSAAGVFQFVKNTGKAYGLDDSNRFDINANVRAGVRHYADNLNFLERKYPHLTGDARATMIYALHHDGPSLKYGGEQIAQEKLIPELARFRSLIAAL